jgi:SOS-response transcriptional repressor LexA
MRTQRKSIVKSVNSELTRKERTILKFLLDEYKKTSKFPTIEETRKALGLPYDEKMEEKMIRQFAKRGLCGVGLTENQKKLFKYIVDQYSKYDAIHTFNEIKRAFELTSKELSEDLAKLERIGLVRRDENNPRKILPPPIKIGYDHTVLLKDGRREKPACAIDALGLPFMYDQDATILSKDPVSRQEIRIEIQKGQIVSQQPKDLFVYFGSDCATILFFTSNESFEEWKSMHPDQSGVVLDMSQALILARRLFEKRLELDYAPSCIAYDLKRRSIKLLEVPDSGLCCK